MHVYIVILTGGKTADGQADWLVRASHDPCHTVSIHRSWARPIPSNRVLISEAFMASGADYMLMLDSDVVPKANLLDLVAYDYDVVTFPTPIWRPGTPEPPIVINVTPLDDRYEIRAEGEPFQVRRGGGSAILIARRVFEGLPQPWWEYDFDARGVAQNDEDIGFCDAVRQHGFEVWCAPAYICDHIKEIGLLEVYEAVAQWRSGGVRT